jgi:anti-sigma factor RsiW
MTDKTACDRFERSLDAYLGDALASREREAARRHASSCPKCLARLTRQDPLQIFLPLSAEIPSSRVTDGFWDSVRAGIERERAAGKREAVPMHPVRPGRLAAFAGRGFTPIAIAASLLVMVLAAYLAAVAPAQFAPLDRNDRSASGAGIASAAAARLPRVSVVVAGNPLPQTLEHVRTDDARDVQIYSMTWLDQDASSGHDPNQVTELILIVDAGLKL